MNEAENHVGADGHTHLRTPAKTDPKKIGPLDLNRWTADSALPRCPAAVLLALIRTVDNETWSWPKGGEEAPGGICMAKVAARAKYSKRSTQRGTRLLEDLGLVKCTQRAWQVNAFEIYPEKIKAFADDKKAARTALRALEQDDDEDLGGEDLPEVEGGAPAAETERPKQDARHAYVPLPSWALYGTRARGVKGPEAVEITRVVVETIRGHMALEKMGTYARPILHLYEVLNRPDLASWVKDVELVAEAAKHCGDRLWFLVRGYAADGLAQYEDRRESPRELCRVSKWEERLAAARRHAEGRCTCAAHSQAPELSDAQEDRTPAPDEPKVVVPVGQEAGFCSVRPHDLLAVWTEAQASVANAHGSLAASWLKNVDASHVEDDGTVVLTVPNRAIREYIAAHYLPELQAVFRGPIGFTLAEATGPPGSRSRP